MTGPRKNPRYADVAPPKWDTSLKWHQAEAWLQEQKQAGQAKPFVPVDNSTRVAPLTITFREMDVWPGLALDFSAEVPDSLHGISRSRTGMKQFTAFLFFLALQVESAFACGYPVTVVERGNQLFRANFAVPPNGFILADSECIEAAYLPDGSLCNTNQFAFSVSAAKLLFFSGSGVYCTAADKTTLRREYMVANAFPAFFALVLFALVGYRLKSRRQCTHCSS